MKFARRLVPILAFAVNLAAQSGPSVIVGRVTSQGKPLPNATVRIDSDVIQSTRLTRTTTRGTFWAAVLPPGTYQITFSHAHTETITRKAVIRLGETVRVDADLPPDDDGASVTKTSITRSIAERPDLTSSLEPSTVDALPLAPELTSRMILAPGVLGGAVRGSTGNLTIVDGVYQRRRGANVEIEDAIDGAAVIETVSSPEFGRFSGGVVLATTRSGGNDLSASLRETMTRQESGHAESRVEATVGGRLIRDVLWFFLAGQDGTDAGFGRERSGLAKLTASPTSRLSLSASVLRAPVPGESRASGDATVIASHRAIVEAHADTNVLDGVRDQHELLAIHSLVPTPWGDHAVVAGGEKFDGERSAFATDSWSDGLRWVLTAGARYDDQHGTSPRAGAAFDIHGDGSARLVATYGRYTGDDDTARETALAWTQRVLTSGFGRIALVRRSYDSGLSYKALELEARADYLFLSFGGNASVARTQSYGAAWMIATAPGVEQHVSLALLERYRSGPATDLALQYRFSRMNVEPFAKVDVLNIFDRSLTISEDPLGARRAVRISFGARM